MNKVIEVNRLSKVFRVPQKAPGLRSALKGLFSRHFIEVQAVREISFSVSEGELVGFLGPNGAGKTTTLKMLSGLLHPTSGEAHVLGHVPWKRERSFQKQFTMVMGQRTQLWWELPAWDTFLLNKEIYEIPDDAFLETVRDLSRLLEIDDLLEIPVKKLSLGQRMKAELACSLLHNPHVLLLDEPTIGLDVVMQQKVRKFIQSYNHRRRATILLTSHNMDDVSELCSRVVLIDHGQIFFDGQLSSIHQRYGQGKLADVIRRVFSEAHSQRPEAG